MAPAPIRDLILGRLGLPTVLDPVTEALGSAVSNIGDVSAVGQRRAKGFTLTFAIHGTPGDSNLYATGLRQRRQLRSLVQNHEYRLAGTYVRFAWDPERNGWLVIGEAELADDNGGVPFAEFKLTLSQVFLVGQLATAREGYRVDLTDLRAITAPIDYLGQVINSSADFAGLTPLALSFLPVGSSDVQVLEKPLAVGARASKDGSCPVCVGRSMGEVISWERPESQFNLGDVVALDRRGVQSIYAFGHSWMAGFYASDYGGRYTDGNFGGLIAPDLSAAGLVAASLGAAHLNYAIGGARAAYPTYGPQPGTWAWLLQNVTRSNNPAAAPPSALYLIGVGLNDLAPIPVGSLGPVTEALRTMCARCRSCAVFEDSDASISYGAGWAQVATSTFANLCGNPLTTSDLTGWVTTGAFLLNAGATLTSDATSPNVGAASGKVVTTSALAFEGIDYPLAGTFAAGVTYTVSVWLRGNAGGENVQIAIGQSGDYLGWNVALTTGWARYSMQWTPSGNRSSVTVAVRTQAASAYTFWVNAIQPTQTAAAVPYSAATPGLSSGTTMHKPPVGGSSATISVPASFQGGTINLGFTTIASMAGAASGTSGYAGTRFIPVSGAATWQVAVDGGAPANYLIDGPTMVTAQANDGGGAIGTVYRIGGLAPGAHTITVALASQTGSISSFLDYWQIEAPTPPLVTLVEQYYVPAAGIVSFPWCANGNVDALNAIIAAAAGPFTDGRVVVSARPQIPLVSSNFYTDNLHPTNPGHAIIAAAAEEAIAPVFGGAEEVYGWDFPWSWQQAGANADTPSLCNGLVRLDYDVGPQPGWFVYAWNPTVGAYVRQGKIYAYRNGDVNGYCDTLLSAALMEWTPDRAVLQAVMRNSLDAYSREVVYITLQRGWTGPRVEIYPAPVQSGANADASVVFLPTTGIGVNDSVAKIDFNGGHIQATAGSGQTYFPAFAYVGGTTFSAENEVAWLRQLVTPQAGFTPSGPFQLNVAVLQAGASASVNQIASTSELFIGSNSAAGYISAQLGFVIQQPDQILEAESMTLAAGTTAVADALASGGNAAQASRTVDAVHVARATWPNGALGKYRVFARLRPLANTADVISVYAKTAATTGATKTATGAAYVTADLGDIVADGSTLEIHAWNGTAARTFNVDRIEAFLLEDRAAATPAYGGARDLGQSELYDSRVEIRRVSRAG